MKEMLLKKFLFHFVNDQRKDKKFCFILGAGASKQSGIRTGSELAKLWIDELIQMESESAIQDWLQKENIPPDDLAQGYSKIYDKRFEVDPRDGFSFLEKEMENIDPSCGYSVLANILSSTEHKIVITTNFDSLCEDALFIYTQKKPLVVGHEALANFIRPFGSRPVVIKIHRDLFLSPKSNNEDTCSLADGFKKNLTDIFKYYTPIVIGYGGNDGSLMNYLSELSAIEGGLFWFYHKDHSLSEKISKIVEKFNGYAVPIDGFDELMIQLGDKLNYAPMDTKIIEFSEVRAKKYREQFDAINKGINLAGETKQALKNIVERTEVKNWWYYQQLINNETDIAKQNELYKEYLSILPNSPELTGNYAIFLDDIRKNYEEAEKYYKKALELEPSNANNNGSYAIFLKNIRKNYEEAEKYYKKALELDPSNANNNGNYANFLNDIRKNYEEAEKYYKKALDLDPSNATFNGNYAIFLNDFRKNYEEAEKYFKKALGLDPSNATNNGNYAIFLKNIRKNYEEAEKYYKKALELEPSNANNNGSYAYFLNDIRKNYEEAEKYYKKALDLDPSNVTNNGNYAIFLKNFRKNYKEAEKYYKKALELDPSNANNNGNYANFLNDIRKNYEEAEKYYKKALDLDPSNANNNGNYAKFLIEMERLNEARNFIDIALNINKDEKEKTVSLELHFYCYAVYWKEYSEAKQNVLNLLQEGVRSPDWDLEGVIKISAKLGHPELEEVKRLAKIISEKNKGV